MFELTNKKALVTGSSRGIGRGIALTLAKQGADVAINYYSKAEQAKAVADEIAKLGRKAFIVQADVSKKNEVTAMFDEVKKRFGGLDILVNNAGILAPSVEIEKVEEKTWDQIIDTNLKGQFLTIQAALPLMKTGGKIINIASVSSGGVGIGFPQITPYTASKGGVVALTENLALDLGRRGINVNSIAPGAINTDMGGTTNEEVMKGLLMRVPKGRIGQPEDIGAAAVFLASDEADYITGATLYVDGGWLAA